MQGAWKITIVKTLAARAKWAREQRRMSQEQIAALAGVTQSTIGNIESGLRQNPRELLSIAAALNVTPEWLKTGRGVVHPPTSNVHEVQSRARVPLISWIQAGDFLEVQDPFAPGDGHEFIEVYDTMPGEHSFALRVVGDSMTSPVPGALSFPEGTVIVVDPSRGCTAGDYVVAKDTHTHEATFKRLAHDGGRWFLRPLNPAYPTVEIDDPNLHVIGRVIEYQLRGKL